MYTPFLAGYTSHAPLPRALKVLCTHPYPTPYDNRARLVRLGLNPFTAGTPFWGQNYFELV